MKHVTNKTEECVFEIVDRHTHTITKTLDKLINEYSANAYAIEDRGNGAANDPERLLEYDECAKEDYGNIILTETSGDVWMSEWQNPNTRGEYDFRIIYG